MSKVYEIVTNRIVELLEQGEIPWRKPQSLWGQVFTLDFSTIPTILFKSLLPKG